MNVFHTLEYIDLCCLDAIAIIVSDVNECTAGTHLCGTNSQCDNTEGGYDCSCDVGYVLQNDQRTCLRE